MEEEVEAAAVVGGNDCGINASDAGEKDDGLSGGGGVAADDHQQLEMNREALLQYCWKANSLKETRKITAFQLFLFSSNKS